MQQSYATPEAISKLPTQIVLQQVVARFVTVHLPRSLTHTYVFLLGVLTSPNCRECSPYSFYIESIFITLCFVRAARRCKLQLAGNAMHCRDRFFVDSLSDGFVKGCPFVDASIKYKIRL